MSDPPIPPTPPAPFGGRITSVRGRNTVNPERGLPKLSEIAIEDADGRLIEAALEAFPAGASLSTARLVSPIGPGSFESCPVCLAAEGTTFEHVPPKAFGGYAMTKTCARCNNRLGSHTESAMQDWFDGAARIHYSTDDNPRPFGHDRAFLRPTPDGQFVLVAEKAGSEDDEFHHRMRQTVRGYMHVAEPRAAEYKTGFLKSAYLAASLCLRGVPDLESARDIRVELLAARDAKRRDVVLGERARAIGVYRTGQPATGPTLALLRDEDDRYLLSLAGTILVDWPFPEVDPATVAFLPRV